MGLQAGARSRPRTALLHHGTGSGATGHLCPLPSRWVRAVNKSPKCLLFLSPPFLPANSFLSQCILVVLPSCPGFCCWGHREEGTLPCLSCPFPGRSWPLQGLGSGRHFHCIQLGFSSLMIISRAHPDSTLIQPLEFCPYVLPKFEVGAKGQCQAGQSGVGAGCVSCLAGCCALPAPSPLKRTMLSYLSLLPLLTGWRCLSAMLFSVLAPTGQDQNCLKDKSQDKSCLNSCCQWPCQDTFPLVRARLLCSAVSRFPKHQHCRVTCSSSHPGSHFSITPCGWPCPPCQPHIPHRAGGDLALSQPVLGGRAEQLLLVSQSVSSSCRKGHIISRPQIIWGTALLKN